MEKYLSWNVRPLNLFEHAELLTWTQMQMTSSSSAKTNNLYSVSRGVCVSTISLCHVMWWCLTLHQCSYISMNMLPVVVVLGYSADCPAVGIWIGKFWPLHDYERTNFPTWNGTVSYIISGGQHWPIQIPITGQPADHQGPSSTGIISNKMNEQSESQFDLISIP